MNSKIASNIFLIGYRCTGKTSVGRRLAVLTGRVFVDTDDRLTVQYGGTIAGFVADHGWEEFRRMESVVLKAVSGEENRVVATGGGIVLAPENVAVIKDRGLVIWLMASPEVIANRMASDPESINSRPGLTAFSRLEEIEKTLAERTPLYRKAMDFSIDTDGMAVEDVCRRVIEITGEKG